MKTEITMFIFRWILKANNYIWDKIWKFCACIILHHACIFINTVRCEIGIFFTSIIMHSKKVELKYASEYLLNLAILLLLYFWNFWPLQN